MFAARYFPARYFARRFWPAIGATTGPVAVSGLIPYQLPLLLAPDDPGEAYEVSGIVIAGPYRVAFKGAFVAGSKASKAWLAGGRLSASFVAGGKHLSIEAAVVPAPPEPAPTPDYWSWNTLTAAQWAAMDSFHWSHLQP